MVPCSQNTSTHRGVAHRSVHARARVQLRSAQCCSIRDAHRSVPCHRWSGLAHRHTHVRAHRVVVCQVRWRKCHRLARRSGVRNGRRRCECKRPRHTCIPSAQCRVQQGLAVGDPQGCRDHIDRWRGLTNRKRHRPVHRVVVRRVCWREHRAQRLVPYAQNRSTHWRIAECSVHACHRIQLLSAQCRPIRDSRWIIPRQHWRGFAYSHTHVRAGRCVVPRVCWRECNCLSRRSSIWNNRRECE